MLHRCVDKECWLQLVANCDGDRAVYISHLQYTDVRRGEPIHVPLEVHLRIQLHRSLTLWVLVHTCIILVAESGLLRTFFCNYR